MRRDELFHIFLPRDLTGAHKRRVEMRFFAGKTGTATERARVLTRVIRNARLVEEPDVQLSDDLVQRVIARGEIRTPSGLVPVHCYAFVDENGRALPFGTWRSDSYVSCADCIAENMQVRSRQLMTDEERAVYDTIREEGTACALQLTDEERRIAARLVQRGELNPERGSCRGPHYF